MNRTPVSFNGGNMPANQMKSFMEEWSTVQAEQNHVETIEEANDFNIQDEDEDEFFTQTQTVYEMHDAAEENLQLYQEQNPAPLPTEEGALTPEQAEPAPTPEEQLDKEPPLHQEGSRGGTPRADGVKDPT